MMEKISVCRRSFYLIQKQDQHQKCNRLVLVLFLSRKFFFDSRLKPAVEIDRRVNIIKQLEPIGDFVLFV